MRLQSYAAQYPDELGNLPKSELLELCPTISRTSVEGALRQLVKEGVIIRHGSGRATFYTRND